MKTRLPQSVCAAAVCSLTAITSLSGSALGADIPTGFIKASAPVVRVGEFPKINWEINYPVTVADVIKVPSPGVMVPSRDVKMDVRMLGAGVTVSYKDGSNMHFATEEAFFKIGGSSYQSLFYGTNDDVSQGVVLRSQEVSANTPIYFKGRYWDENTRAWSVSRASGDGSGNVQVLKNGDRLPTTYNIANAPTLEGFLKPYLDSGGRLKIGPMDMVVAIELTHTQDQRTELGYDLQDLVFLVTFKND